MPDPSTNPSAKHGDQLAFRESDKLGDFCELILSTIQEPILILRSDLRIEAANPAFYRHFRVDAEQTIGRKLYDLENGQWEIPELRRLLEEVLSKGIIVKDYRVDHKFEGLGRRIMLVSANRLERGGGEAWIVLAILDNTEIELAKEYSDKIVDGCRDPFLVLDWDLRVKTANEPFYKAFRLTPSETEGRLVYELGNGQWEIPRLRELLEDILPRESTFDDFEVEHDFEQIGHRVMLLNARRVDTIKSILLVIEDVTDQRRADFQQKVLLGELQHRVKNLLMIVRALSQQTLQGASSLEAFADSFDGRLDAMARTQDLLVRGPSDQAPLADILRLEFEALGAKEVSKFNLIGPEVELSARASHAMAMMVHELATNAAKYGALSAKAPEGRIDITWSIGPGEEGKLRFHFNWREYGVSGSTSRTRTGFGTQMIESSVPYLFGGSSTLSFHADGVECVLNVSLPSEEITVLGVERS